MKIIKVEEGLIDTDKGTEDYPYQCEFDTADTKGDLFIVTLDGDFGTAFTQLFDKTNVGFPSIFFQTNSIPTKCDVHFEGDVIKVRCKDRYFRHCTLTTLDTDNGADNGEAKEIIIDTTNCTEIKLINPGDEITVASGYAEEHGPSVTFTSGTTFADEDVTMWAIKCDSNLYYLKLPIHTSAGNTIKFDRFLKAYKVIE